MANKSNTNIHEEYLLQVQTLMDLIPTVSVFKQEQWRHDD